MTAFRRAAAKHAAAVQAVSGERLMWMPQADGQDDAAAGGPDPDRPAREITATVTRRPLVVERVGDGADSKSNVKLASAAWRVSYPATYPAELGHPFREGDLVRRLDEPGQPVLRISTSVPINGRDIHPADEVSG